MRRKRFAVLAAVLGTVASFTLVGAASAAPGPATLSIDSPVVLNSDGTLSVTVRYSCASGDSAGGEVYVQQSVRNVIATGMGYLTSVTCDGTEHNEVVQVSPTGGPGFKSGKAFVGLRFGICDPTFSCTELRPGDFVRVARAS
jgi:hypothetical protein